MQYTRTAISGAAWLTAVKIFTKTFSVAKYFILARLVSPYEFGLAGVAFLVLGLIDTCTETGLIQAFIQLPKDEEKYTKTVWTTLAIRGLLITFLMLITSSLVNHIYAPGTIHLTVLASAALFIKGLANPNVMLLRKYALYHKEFLFQVIPSFTDSVFTILFAWFFRNGLALILGTLMGTFTATIMSYFLSQKFRSQFSYLRLKSLYSYGRWITVGGVLSYFTEKSDDLVVGKILGPFQLGLYQMAYRVSNAPTTEGAGLIYQVVFPLFSRLQNEPVRLKRGVAKILGLNFLLSLSFALVIYLALPVFIPIVLTPAWIPIIPVVNLMLIFGIIRCHISTGLAYFDAVGRPEVATLAGLFKLVGLVILVIPLTRGFGLIGTAWSVVLSQAVVAPWFFYRLYRSLNP